MQVFIKFAAKTVQDIILGKQVETYQSESRNTKENLNQAIFPML